MSLFWSFLPQRFPGGCVCSTLTLLLSEGTSCGCWCCLFLLLMLWAVHCTLVLKAVWIATKHAGWSRLHDWHGRRDVSVTRLCWQYLLLSQHVGSFFFVCLFSCTITIITSSMIAMSGCCLIDGCVYGKAVLLPPSYFSLWKTCLLVSVRGYCMLHGWIMGLMSVVRHSFC